jgi:S1-C subfamily serine protease
MQAVAAAALVVSTAVGATVIAAQNDAPAAEVQTSERPYVGVALQVIDGALTVIRVAEGSPAAEAGFAEGDVITAINDTAMTTVEEAAAAIAGLSVGDTISVTFTRDGEEQTAEVTLAAAPDRGFRGGRPIIREIINDFPLSYDAETNTFSVGELAEDSPLYEAGLRSGDVITAINGEPFEPGVILETLMQGEAEATLTVTVERDGESQDIEISADALRIFGRRGDRLEQFMMPGFEMRPFGGRGQGEHHGGRLGLAFLPLDEQVAADNGVTLTEGALVMEVEPESPAAEAGLVAGDIITAVNGEAVNEEWTLRDRIRAYEPGDVVTLSVTRGEESLSLEVTLAEPVRSAMFMMPDGMMLPFDFSEVPGLALPFGEGQLPFDNLDVAPAVVQPNL